MQERKIFHRMAGVAALALLFGLPSAQAQSGNTSAAQGSSGTSAASSGSSASSAKLSRADQNMMKEMAQSNLSEIEAGKIALSQSKNEQVRNFAQKMVDDHTQAQKDLEQLAQAKGVTLPTEPDNKHKAAAKKLSALQGDKFDKRYMSQGGLADHKQTHSLLERAQSRASDPDLKALAAKMAPVVDQHMTMAQEVTESKSAMSGTMGPAGTSSMSGSSGSTTGAGKSGASGTSGSSNSTSPGK